MWIFTKYGFFSAVCARQGEGEYYQPVNLGSDHDPGQGS